MIIELGVEDDEDGPVKNHAGTDEVHAMVLVNLAVASLNDHYP